jgi:hypothetical protein
MSGSQSAKTKRQVNAYLQQIQEKTLPALILSTGKYIGEGFNFPQLDTLILASPIAWKGNVIQYAGRVSRAHTGKTEILIFDYVDFKLPVFVRMFAKRVNAYKKIGFSLSTDGKKPSTKLLFSVSDYREALERDLVASNGPIFFSIPYLLPGKVGQLKIFLQMIASTRKVAMRIHASPTMPASTVSSASYPAPLEQVCQDLRDLGIQVETTDDELANYILIGDRLVWYGSIHIFGKVESDETLLRLDDPTYQEDFRQLALEDRVGISN